MEPELLRTYYPIGTNGKILLQGRLISYGIKCSWKNNHTRVSCISGDGMNWKKEEARKFSGICRDE